MSGFPYDYIIDMSGNTYKRVVDADAPINDDDPASVVTRTYVMNHTVQESLPTNKKRDCAEIIGVWFVYGVDQNAYPVAVFGEEIHALRYAVNMGYDGLRVTFWPYEVDWSELMDRKADDMTPLPTVTDR